MTYKASEFLSFVVKPVLVVLEKDSIVAQQLLVGTAIQESLLMFTQQNGGGPALGYFQMEPATHDDIWDNYLKYKKTLAGKIRALANVAEKKTPAASLLQTDDFYAAAMARAHYARKSAPLPTANDVEGLASYWKVHYNTVKGKGRADEFVVKWKQHGAGDLAFG